MSSLAHRAVPELPVVLFCFVYGVQAAFGSAVLFRLLCGQREEESSHRSGATLLQM